MKSTESTLGREAKAWWKLQCWKLQEYLSAIIFWLTKVRILGDGKESEGDSLKDLKLQREELLVGK